MKTLKPSYYMSEKAMGRIPLITKRVLCMCFLHLSSYMPDNRSVTPPVTKWVNERRRKTKTVLPFMT